MNHRGIPGFTTGFGGRRRAGFGGRRPAGFGGVLTTVMLLAAAVATPIDLEAKSYTHPTIEQTISLTSDGNLEVVDLRTYAFEGEFHNAFLTIDPRSGGEVRFREAAAADGKSFRNQRIEGETIRWQYDAEDETRSFRIAYELTGEVERATDAALIDRQFVEPAHAPIDSYRMTLRLPQPASLFKVFVFTERGIVGDLDVRPEDGVATIAMSGIGSDEWVRVRILFDPDQVPGVAKGDGPRYETWLSQTADESRTFRESGGVPHRKPLPSAFAVLFLAAAGIFAAWAYRTWRSLGVEPEIEEVGTYQREPPEEVPAGVVPFLLTQSDPGVNAASAAAGATLLDLARRGFITLRERRKEGFLGIGAGTEIDFVLEEGRSFEPLAPFEARLWEKLDHARGSDRAVTPKELKRSFEKQPEWIREWCKLPRPWYEEKHGPLLERANSGWQAVFLLLGIGLLVGMIWAGRRSENPVVMGSAVAGGALSLLAGIVCSRGMPRWYPESLRRSRQWKAYGKFLSDFSAMEDAPAEHFKLWDYHFVYATALGVSKKYLSHLKKLMERNPESFSHPAWYASSGSTHGPLTAAQGMTSAQTHLAALQANLSALESALSATTSSGGGFSGGGSGGSSGGGGGSGAS